MVTDLRRLSADPAAVAGGEAQSEDQGTDASGVVVTLRLPDGSLYDQDGRINFVDVTTNTSTDSVTVRAEISNPDGILVDAQYVGVVLQAGGPNPPSSCRSRRCSSTSRGPIRADRRRREQAQVRRVETGPAKGADIVVSSGLRGRGW